MNEQLYTFSLHGWDTYIFLLQKHGLIRPASLLKVGDWLPKTIDLKLIFKKQNQH